MLCPHCNSVTQPDWKYCPYCTMSLYMVEGKWITANNAPKPLYADFAKIRAKNTGIDWYIWSTGRDSRVRASHKQMEGVIINWDDPPSPEILHNKESLGYYHAGGIDGCRCTALPLLQLSDVRWPHKVYRDGKIVRMRKEEFRLIFNGVLE